MKVIYPKNFSPSRNKVILDYCKWKKVLHIWACDAPYTKEKYNWDMWPLLYREIDKICSYQLWIDLDKESIQFLNSKKSEFKNSKIDFFDMNKLEDLDFEPDIIIFGEVIEHLMNLEIALTNLKKVMSDDTLLIISTPNAYHVLHQINAILWFENMHEDHKVYFSYWYLQNLLKYNWIKIEKWFFTFLDYNKNILNWKWKIMIFFAEKIFCKLFPSTSSVLLVITKKNDNKI